MGVPDLVLHHRVGDGGGLPSSTPGNDHGPPDVGTPMLPHHDGAASSI